VKLWKTVGKMMDDQTALMRTARAVTTPDGALAAGYSDALDQGGLDRMIPRGATAPNSAADETDAAYAARLDTAYDLWGGTRSGGGGAGTAVGMLKALLAQGFPSGINGTIIMSHIGRWYAWDDALLYGDTMDAVNRQQTDGSVPTPVLKGFTLDSRDQFYSKFMIVFGQDVSGLTDTSTIAKARLNKTVREWKSASAVYCGAVVVVTNGVWGYPLTDLWGDSGTWGDGVSRYISPT
jgi:hypothetical protein